MNQKLNSHAKCTHTFTVRQSDGKRAPVTEYSTQQHRRQCRRGCRGRDPPIFDLQGSSCVDSKFSTAAASAVQYKINLLVIALPSVL